MIRVTVELLPLGDASKRRTLGVMDIANDGTGDVLRGNYAARTNADDEACELIVDGSVRATIPKSTEYARTAGVWKRGVVRGFDRRRLGPWDLLYLVLRTLVGGRNP